MHIVRPTWLAPVAERTGWSFPAGKFLWPRRGRRTDFGVWRFSLVVFVLVLVLVCSIFSDTGKNVTNYTAWWLEKAGPVVMHDRRSIVWATNLGEAAEWIAAQEIGSAELVTILRCPAFRSPHATAWQSREHLYAEASKNGFLVRRYSLAEIVPGGFLVVQKYDPGKPSPRHGPEIPRITSGANSYWRASCPVPSHP